MHLTTRRQQILTGAIAVLVVVAATTVGIKGAFGAFRGGYELVGTFDAAGQGLLPGSDVKIRGVNIGEVQRIDLVDGAARIRIRVNSGEEIPIEATATIRPKTLFGEKFVDVDPGPTEGQGDILRDGDEIAHTEGGFELEAVLTALHPLLEAVNPDDLMVILDQLAEGGRGLGETVNRTLVNSAELGQVFADNAELTSEFLTDLAALSDQLAASAGDLLGLADAGNAALPTLITNEAALVDLLQQTGRLSNDVADLLEHNQPFVEAVFEEGSKTLDLLYQRQDRVIPLVVGLRQYVETLASTIRIDMGDGTLMAAVKGVLGGEVCGLLPCAGLASGTGTTTGGTSPMPPPSSSLPASTPPPTTVAPSEPPPADDPLLSLLRKLLGA